MKCRLRQLVGALGLWCAVLGLCVASASAADDEFEFDDFEEGQPDGEGPGAWDTPDDEGDDESEDGDGDSDGDAVELPPMDEAPSSDVGEGLPPMEDEPAPAPSRIELLASVGLGVGTRAFQRPTFRGQQKLPDTAFAAARVSFRTLVMPAERLSFEVLIAYHTSLGLEVREQPQFALPQDIEARSSHLELSVAPTYRLWDAADALSLSAVVGLSLRDFWAIQDQYQTPDYTLLGPMLRFDLRLPLSGIAELRAGPEFQWVAYVDDDLRQDGVLGDGFGIGIELSATATISDFLGIQLDYREARIYASSQGPLFIDAERFITAGLTGRY